VTSAAENARQTRDEALSQEKTVRQEKTIDRRPVGRGASCNDTNVTTPFVREGQGASLEFYMELFTYYLQMIRNSQFSQVRRHSLPVTTEFHDPNEPSFECDWGGDFLPGDGHSSKIARFFYGP